MHEGPNDATSERAAGREAGAVARVRVAEQPPRPEPPDGASEDDYRWHTYKVYPSGRPDVIEFVDVYKAFGPQPGPARGQHGAARKGWCR